MKREAGSVGHPAGCSRSERLRASEGAVRKKVARAGQHSASHAQFVVRPGMVVVKCET